MLDRFSFVDAAGASCGLDALDAGGCLRGAGEVVEADATGAAARAGAPPPARLAPPLPHARPLRLGGKRVRVTLPRVTDWLLDWCGGCVWVATPLCAYRLLSPLPGPDAAHFAAASHRARLALRAVDAAASAPHAALGGGEAGVAAALACAPLLPPLRPGEADEAPLPRGAALSAAAWALPAACAAVGPDRPPPPFLALLADAAQPHAARPLRARCAASASPASVAAGAVAGRRLARATAALASLQPRCGPSPGPPRVLRLLPPRPPPPPLRRGWGVPCSLVGPCLGVWDFVQQFSPLLGLPPAPWWRYSAALHPGGGGGDGCPAGVHAGAASGALLRDAHAQLLRLISDGHPPHDARAPVPSPPRCAPPGARHWTDALRTALLRFPRPMLSPAARVAMTHAETAHGGYSELGAASRCALLATLVSAAQAQPCVNDAAVDAAECDAGGGGGGGGGGGAWGAWAASLAAAPGRPVGTDALGRRYFILGGAAWGCRLTVEAPSWGPDGCAPPPPTFGYVEPPDFAALAEWLDAGGGACAGERALSRALRRAPLSVLPPPAPDGYACLPAAPLLLGVGAPVGGAAAYAAGLGAVLAALPCALPLWDARPDALASACLVAHAAAGACAAAEAAAGGAAGGGGAAALSPPLCCSALVVAEQLLHDAGALLPRWTRPSGPGGEGAAPQARWRGALAHPHAHRGAAGDDARDAPFWAAVAGAGELLEAVDWGGRHAAAAAAAAAAAPPARAADAAPPDPLCSPAVAADSPLCRLGCGPGFVEGCARLLYAAASCPLPPPTPSRPSPSHVVPPALPSVGERVVVVRSGLAAHCEALRVALPLGFAASLRPTARFTVAALSFHPCADVAWALLSPEGGGGCVAEGGGACAPPPACAVPLAPSPLADYVVPAAAYDAAVALPWGAGDRFKSPPPAPPPQPRWTGLPSVHGAAPAGAAASAPAAVPAPAFGCGPSLRGCVVCVSLRVEVRPTACGGRAVDVDPWAAHLVALDDGGVAQLCAWQARKRGWGAQRPPADAPARPDGARRGRGAPPRRGGGGGGGGGGAGGARGWAQGAERGEPARARRRRRPRPARHQGAVRGGAGRVQRRKGRAQHARASFVVLAPLIGNPTRSPVQAAPPPASPCSAPTRWTCTRCTARSTRAAGTMPFSGTARRASIPLRQATHASQWRECVSALGVDPVALPSSPYQLGNMYLRWLLHFERAAAGEGAGEEEDADDEEEEDD